MFKSYRKIPKNEFRRSKSIPQQNSQNTLPLLVTMVLQVTLGTPT